MSKCLKCGNCRAVIPLDKVPLTKQTRSILRFLPKADRTRMQFLLSEINYKKAIIRCREGFWLNSAGKQRQFKGLDRLNNLKYLKQFETCMAFNSSY